MPLQYIYGLLINGNKYSLLFLLAFKGFSLFPNSHCELTISDAVNLLALI